MANFASTYGRPNRIRAAMASGQLVGSAPKQELSQARTNRRKMVGNLIQKAGGQQAFEKQAYGQNYNPGTLRTALRTVRQSQSQVASGQQPADLLNSDLYKNALAQRKTLLGQRRKTLNRIAGPKLLPGGRPQ